VEYRAGWTFATYSRVMARLCGALPLRRACGTLNNAQFAPQETRTESPACCARDAVNRNRKVRRDQEANSAQLDGVGGSGGGPEARSLNRGRWAGAPLSEAVALAFEGDDVGVVDESVDEGGGDHGVAEDFSPGVEAAV
jgi:hypothetical protein